VQEDPLFPQSIDEGPELFIGLAAAVGTNLDRVVTKLEQALRSVRYHTHQIRLATLLRELPLYREKLRFEPADEYIGTHMTVGDELRKATGKNDALAILAIGEIKKFRQESGATEGKALGRRAYVFRSLKHPEEVKTLRAIYGNAFYLIAAYSPHDQRRDHLAHRIAQSHNDTQTTNFLALAEGLILRDLQELDLGYGQNLRDTYHRADVFLDTTNEEILSQSVSRFIELIFGNTLHTPSRAEYAMVHAKAAALRSAELGRQVGAAVSRDNGDIVAVGTNEVPKAGGGLYWCGDKPDMREFVLGHDSNDENKWNLVGDTLRRLKDAGWLSHEKSKNDISRLVDEAIDGEKPVLSNQSLIRNITEYGRAVHAEMAAIVDAARRGVSIEGCTMYVIAFPCHHCARHVVAAGIKRVVYIEPYPKSLAAELYPDSIKVESGGPSIEHVLFEPFVGVAPRQYIHLFEAGVRKDSRGNAILFDPSKAEMRYSAPARLYIDDEDWALKKLSSLVDGQGSLFGG
jgi:deoxycytidylate deaminase